MIIERTPLPQSRYILFTLCILLIFVQAYRIPVQPMASGLDQSFPHILNLFAFTSMRFGTDIVYTYGPLGFLLAIENVGYNLAIGFAFWTALYLIISIITVYFVFSLTSGWRLIVSIILALLVARFIDTERLIPCLVLLLLIMGYERQQYREKILVICGGLVSIGLLIKFPIGIECAGMAIGSIIIPFKPSLVLRNMFVVMVSIILTFCSVWFIVSGSLKGIVNYFLNSFQLISGYTAVMSSARANEDTSLISFIVALVLIIVMILFLSEKRRIHTFLVMLFPLFIGWKHGVVRFDAHIFGLVNIVMFSVLMLLVLHLHREDTNNSKVNEVNKLGISWWGLLPARQMAAIGIFPAVCISLYLGLSFFENNQFFFSRYYRDVANRWAPGLTPIKNILTFQRYKKYLDSLARTNLSGARLDKSILEILDGKSVDIYSYELGFVAANPELNYHPKPIFQHFNAFTDKLDKLNADFFASSDRPEFLIMHHPDNGKMEGVDGRYQLYDDPIAFLQIMSLYKPVFVERDPHKPQVALLEYDLSSRFRFGSPVSFKKEVVRWNEMISLPPVIDSSILRVKINLKKSISSSIKEALFRLSPMYLVYIYSDGTHKKYRLLPTHLSSGVWITPFFENYWSLYDFLSGISWIGPKIVAIRFEADNPHDYSDRLTLTWERIDCKTGYCNPVEERVFTSSNDGRKRFPIPVTSKIITQFNSHVDCIAAIDVRLSTYAKINKGTVALEIVDQDRTVLRESTINAASIRDNAYNLFSFNNISNVKGKKVGLRLSYRAKGDGMIAAWRTANTEPDFDFMVYGH